MFLKSVIKSLVEFTVNGILDSKNYDSGNYVISLDTMS